MSTRKVKDAVDLETGEKIYLRGHATATYLSNGVPVEDAINKFNVVAVDTGSEIEDLEEEYATVGYVDNALSNIELPLDAFEGFISLSRDFNDDFNDDFAR